MFQLHLLSHDLARLSIAKVIIKSNLNQLMIKCFNDYLAVEVSSAFMFCSSMKDSQDFEVGSSELISGERLRATPSEAMRKLRQE